MYTRRRITLPLAVLSLVAISSCYADSNEFRTYGSFAVRSTGEGQLSTGVYSIAVRTAGKLAVNYLAPRLHCASLRMHFLVDGSEKAVSGVVAPGRATGYADLGSVTPGNHVVGLQAEGILGGCDTGRVTAWEGSAEVWTTLLPGDHSNLRANGLGQLILEIGHQHYGDHFQSDGTYVTEDGAVYRYATEDNGAAPWTPSPHADGEYAEIDLREKYSHSPRLVGHVTAHDFEDLKHAAYRVNAIGSTPAPSSKDVQHAGQTIDRTEYRVYRRQQATGDYDSELIAQFGDVSWGNSSEPGTRLRAWLDRIARGEGYAPVGQIVCVRAPCPQYNSGPVSDKPLL